MIDKLLWKLTFVFMFLRIVGVIEWHWFWVLSPIIFFYALFIFLVTYELFKGGENGKDLE